MATLRSTCSLSARLLRQTIRNDAPVRGFSTAGRCLAAQNFTMPALSPTMTEGNIATWKVREGESYAAGDVLLEIETDKATMDVEAQEDGILMKIMQGDGAKSVQVGTRIAVTAEPGDDVKSLQLPPDDKAGQAQDSKSDSKADSPTPPAEQPSAGKKKSVGENTTGEAHEQKYPLLPSVEHLVKQHQIDEATVRTITPTGPGGRLLKGDVLAYLGEIDSKRPAEIASFLKKLSQLDLSNIKLAKREPSEEKKAKTKDKAAPTLVEDVLVPLDQQVSLVPLLHLQARVKGRLGTTPPLDILIKRAIEAANADLPALPVKKSPDDLFNEILGMAPRTRALTSRGNYSPARASTSASASVLSSSTTRFGPPPDIIDILTTKGPIHQNVGIRSKVVTQEPAIRTESFGLVVTKEEQQRAQVFMNKLEYILTQEPERLLFEY